MGAPKQKWTSEEEEALRAGVAKHGTGKWKNIQKDPEFGHCLSARSNIDLKDKWRNMSVSASGQGSREKFKTPKLKALSPPPLSNSTTPSSLPAAQDASGDTVMDSTKSPADGKTRYNTMIFEALSTLKDPNGSDISSIIGFIEQRQEVPSNFRRLLSTKLKRLVQQDKLEKVQNCYKMKKDGTLGQRTSTIQKQKDDQHQKQSLTPLENSQLPRQKRGRFNPPRTTKQTTTNISGGAPNASQSFTPSSSTSFLKPTTRGGRPRKEIVATTPKTRSQSRGVRTRSFSTKEGTK